MAKLYIVPTPIGNLEDFTFRAVRVLKEADVILAEDTRQSGKLLKHYEIDTHLKAYHQHNEHKKLDEFIELIETSSSVAIVTDAGMPGISDPGFLLIRACIENNIHVEALPGACAFITALVASGLPCDSFIFEGFLPQKKGRQTKWKQLAEEKKTIVLYESPHRLLKLMKEVNEYLGENRKVVVGRELTKMFEEYIRGTANDVLKHFEEKKVKGEIVVIIEGA